MRLQKPNADPASSTSAILSPTGILTPAMFSFSEKKTSKSSALLQVPTSKPRAFHSNVDINASTAKMRLVQVAEEIIAVLAADPNADVKVTVEIQVSFPSGASDQTKRAVTENAKTLNFKNADWE